MNCKSCNEQIDDNSKYCSFCGEKHMFITQEKPTLKVVQSHQETNNKIEPFLPFHFNFNTSDLNNESRFDLSYTGEKRATTFGVISLIISTLIIFSFRNRKFETWESERIFYEILQIVFFLLHVLIPLWVCNIAKRQNRNIAAWGIGAFIFPSITLIIISTKKKLFAKANIVETLDAIQNSKNILEKAKEFYFEKRYLESARFAEKSLFLNPENESAKLVLQKSNEQISIIKSKQSSGTSKVLKINDGRLLKVDLNDNQLVGSEVSIDGQIATDGAFTILRPNHFPTEEKFYVKDGKIFKIAIPILFGEIIIETTMDNFPQFGDLVFNKNGEIPSDGKYKQGLFQGSITVKDGKFVKW